MKIKELSDACVKHEVNKLNEQWNLPIDRELHGDVTTTEYDDHNRPRLLLRQIQKVRKMNDLKKVEKSEHAELVATMYSYIEPKEKPKDSAASE